ASASRATDPGRTPRGALQHPIAGGASRDDGKGVGKIRRQRFPEPHRGAPHLGFDRAQRQVEGRRDLLVAVLLAATEQEDLATPVRQAGNRMLHGAVELALDIAILWAPSGPGGALLTGGAVDPRFSDAPMAQVFQSAVPGRHVEVALREAD